VVERSSREGFHLTFSVESWIAGAAKSAAKKYKTFHPSRDDR
jgi:hypothetical protein